MKLLLSLCLALLMSSCWDLTGADAGSHEEESTTESPTEYYDDYPTVTPTPDYDYNATFDYYYVTGQYHPDDTKEETKDETEEETKEETKEDAKEDAKGETKEETKEETEEETKEETEEVRSTAAGIGPFSPLLLLGLAVHHIWD